MSSREPLNFVPLTGDFSTPETGKRKLQTTVIRQLPAKYTKSKAEMSNAVDTLLVKTLEDMQDSPSDATAIVNNGNEDTFCKSLVPILKKFPLKKNRLAKLRVNQLFHLEFDDDLNSN